MRFPTRRTLSLLLDQMMIFYAPNILEINNEKYRLYILVQTSVDAHTHKLNSKLLFDTQQSIFDFGIK